MAELMPGWRCPGCQAFNGEAKRERVECRACGALHVEPAHVAKAAREGMLEIDASILEALLRENRLLHEALARVQGRSTEILEECRRLRKEREAFVPCTDVVAREGDDGPLVVSLSPPQVVTLPETPPEPLVVRLVPAEVPPAVVAEDASAPLVSVSSVEGLRSVDGASSVPGATVGESHKEGGARVFELLPGGQEAKWSARAKAAVTKALAEVSQIHGDEANGYFDRIVVIGNHSKRSVLMTMGGPIEGGGLSFWDAFAMLEWTRGMLLRIMMERKCI